jgi:hypothetical protein
MHATTRLLNFLAALAVTLPGLCNSANAPLQLSPGVWFEVPGSKLADIATPPSHGGAIRGITAWSGGAYDSKHERLLVWGGGHSNYSGNEVYAFDLRTRRWSVLSKPSEPDGARTPRYPDGQPRSRHTYNYIEYLPSIDRLVSFGGSGPFPTGGGEFTREIAEFDAEAAHWVSGGRAEVPRPEGTRGSMIGAHARLDPRTGQVIFVPSMKGAIMSYDPAADRWRIGTRNAHVKAHSTAAIDPRNRQLLLIGASRDGGPQIRRWNIDALSGGESLVGQTQGDTEMESAYGPGFDYHPPSGCLVAWSGGADLFALDAGRLHWTRLTSTPGPGGDPGPQNRTGTYGRFRYSNALDAFVLVNGVEQNVWLIRPSLQPDQCRAPGKHG